MDRVNLGCVVVGLGLFFSCVWCAAVSGHVMQLWLVPGDDAASASALPDLVMAAADAFG